MKNLLFTSMLACYFINAGAQTTSGIYLNAEDFMKGKLSFAPTAHEKYRIQLNEFFASPRVTVINGTQKQTYAKDSIFGFRTSNGTSFRFFKREAYEVLNAGGLPLLYKRSVIHGGKGPHSEVSYYFSADGALPVYALTHANIRAAYAADSAFVERVYDSFTTDADLIEYDSYHNKYKLNRIYQTQHTASR